jgi:hypothetical protein
MCVPEAIVNLDLAAAFQFLLMILCTFGEFSLYPNVNTRSTWAYLGIGIKLFDDFPSPRLYFACLVVPAMVKVYPTKLVIEAKLPANPGNPIIFVGFVIF